MKIIALAITTILLTGCGTINTGNDGVDAVYNTTSAIIKNNGDNNCSYGSSADKKTCQRNNQLTVEKLNKHIKKHK